MIINLFVYDNSIEEIQLLVNYLLANLNFSKVITRFYIGRVDNKTRKKNNYSNIVKGGCFSIKK